MYHETIVTCRYRIIPTHQTTNNNQHIYDMHVNVYVIIRTYPQFYHDLITMRGLCRHTWERTHAITLNTTPVPPCKIFIIIRHSRIYTFRKNFDCKKCPVHLVSFNKHHGLFVPYIVDIFDCKKCHTDLVSFTKHHGLFVPYIVDIFIFLIRKSGLISPCTCHLVQGFLFFC